MTKLSNDYIQEIVKECRPFASSGSVIDHIPGKDQSHLTKLGITVISNDGEVYSAGDDDYVFSLQSISKVINLLIALEDFGEDTVFQKVDKEPTDDFFNSISNLEDYEHQKPYNPMLNSGAIAVASLIKGTTVDERFHRVLEFVRTITGNEKVDMDEGVYKAEVKNGARNRSLAYFMESLGILPHQELEAALDLYFRVNSIMVTSHELAEIGCFLARQGKKEGKQMIDPRHVGTTLAIMMTSGMYNESGSYAVDVGFPMKSGVSGGITGVVTGRMGIGLIGPAINKKGNSIAGGKALRKLSQDLNLTLFHT
ncbi:glutaminase [Thalassobacillus devorans]|uniref:Glutaminase n=1 Tax=Thalassobacillus devorans TaxID=279813 RepID=A0ABQ1PS61_9BACI|nr:glutaminase A [Thalassobacillus devorans]NIK30546.1 glutaminase [Thalassobacillus devorans]GGD02092.1 glutaminase [Thalassobacillus devorans]